MYPNCLIKCVVFGDYGLCQKLLSDIQLHMEDILWLKVQVLYLSSYAARKTKYYTSYWNKRRFLIEILAFVVCTTMFNWITLLLLLLLLFLLLLLLLSLVVVVVVAAAAVQTFYV
jgi:hypothetical protein